jgi:hypothetical protein
MNQRPKLGSERRGLNVCLWVTGPQLGKPAQAETCSLLKS